MARTNASLQTICEEMETAFRAQIGSSGTLAFMVGEPKDGITILDSPPEDGLRKNYKRHLICLYPSSDEPFVEIPRIGNRIKREFSIGVLLFKKSQQQRKWLFFSDLNNQRTGIGIFEFCNVVMDILRNNTLSDNVIVKPDRQFSVPSLVDIGDPTVEAVNFEYMTETLSTIDADGVP